MLYINTPAFMIMRQFPTIHSQVPKTEFEEKKNDVLERELLVTCGDCERKHHQVCVLHHPNIWKKG